MSFLSLYQVYYPEQKNVEMVFGLIFVLVCYILYVLVSEAVSWRKRNRK